jgi:hypothetical protein
MNEVIDDQLIYKKNENQINLINKLKMIIISKAVKSKVIMVYETICQI